VGGRQEQTGRLERIDRVIEEVIRRRRRGVPVDNETLQLQHADLMPELARRLRSLPATERAAPGAPHAPSPATPGEGNAADSREDLEFLREGLREYELLERLHQGGQGVVYRALQKSTNRVVAIKVLLHGPLATERQRQRFAREVELVSRLRHANIVTVHESDVVRGCPYFVMEYIDGLPIDDHVRRHDLSVRRTVELFIAVCRAVSSAHQYGIIHRDLKPPNILVDTEGQPHILDFGLAKDLISDPDTEVFSAVSLPGQPVGTLPYLSPEQAGGFDGIADVRSDIYALGVVLYQLLSGALPYELGEDCGAAQRAIVSREPRRLREAAGPPPADRPCRPGGLDDDLDAVVLKALEKQKNRRYQSVAALADDLARWRRGEPVEAKAHRRLYLLRKTLRRYWIQTAVAAAFVALVAGTLVGMTVLWKRAERVARIARTGMQMGGFLRSGELERDAGRVAVAIDLWENALRISDTVPLSDPTVRILRLDALVNLAELYHRDGQHDRAGDYCTAAIELTSQLDPAETGEVQHLRYQAVAHGFRARLARASGDLEEAVRHYDTAVPLQQRLVSLHPGKSRHEQRLADLHDDRGDVLQLLGRFDRASEDYRTALALHLDLHAREPFVVDYLLRMYRDQGRLGLWHARQQTPEDARTAWQWLRRARAGLLHLQASGDDTGRESDVQNLVGQLEPHLAALLERQADRPAAAGHAARDRGARGR